MLMVGYFITSSLQEAITSKAEVALEETARSQLEQMTLSGAQLLKRRRQVAELALQLQATAVEERLRAPFVKSLKDHPVYFAEDFSENVPDGMKLSDRHYKREPNTDRPQPMEVNFSHASTLKLEDLKITDEKKLLPVIADLNTVYDSLNLKFPDLFYWQYTTLEKGLHNSFPGKGGYPDGYDPRKREWYLQAKNTGDTVWNPVSIDATSGMLIISVSKPVHTPSGKFAGVTGIDIPLSVATSMADLPGQWKGQVEAMVVDPSQLSPLKNGMLIIAHQGYEFPKRAWNEPIQQSFLSSSDVAKFEELLGKMTTREHGVIRMPHNGRDSLWAFCEIEKNDAAVIFILPYESVIQEISEVEGFFANIFSRSLSLVTAFTAAVFAGSFLGAILMARRFTRPMRHLLAASRKLAQGDFSVRVNETTTDERQELIDAFNTVVPQLEEHMKIKDSLAIAREIQTHLLPARAPELPGIEAYGRSIYCDETGGDYFDYFVVSESDTQNPESEHATLTLMIGDVTGHGITSALLMTTGRALLRNAFTTPIDPREGLSKVNTRMAADTYGGRFMTLFALDIDPQKRTLTWSSAGHDPALMFNPKTGEVEELGNAGVALGILPEWDYKTETLKDYPAGAFIFLGTDGIWEAQNDKKEMFGKERMTQLVEEAGRSGSTPKELCEKMISAVKEFTGSEPQGDDITLVAAKLS